MRGPPGVRQRIVEWHFREPRGSFYSWLGVALGCVLMVVGFLFVETLPVSPVLLDSPADRWGWRVFLGGFGLAIVLVNVADLLSESRITVVGGLRLAGSAVLIVSFVTSIILRL
jgi:hypothetical protein